MIEVHITYRNDYGVTTEEHRQYSKSRQMALIPAADNVADDCHPLCILCFGPAIHSIRCIPDEQNNAVMANDEGLNFRVQHILSAKSDFQRLYEIGALLLVLSLWLSMPWKWL